MALFNYDPPTMSPNPDACDEELGFSEGQLIKVYGDKDPDGFYWGEAGGQYGYVPCNMVSEVQVCSMFPNLSTSLPQSIHISYTTTTTTTTTVTPTAYLPKVDDERVAVELLKESESGRRRRDGSVGRRADRWGDIYANMTVRKMVALYDYDPQELSPNVDSEVGGSGGEGQRL